LIVVSELAVMMVRCAYGLRWPDPLLEKFRRNDKGPADRDDLLTEQHAKQTNQCDQRRSRRANL
jgi:hypothetical protein